MCCGWGGGCRLVRGHSCSGGLTLLGGAPALVGHLHRWPQGQTIPRAWEGGPAWVLWGQPVHLLDVQDVTRQAGCVWLRAYTQVPISSLSLHTWIWGPWRTLGDVQGPQRSWQC